MRIHGWLRIPRDTRAPTTIMGEIGVQSLRGDRFPDRARTTVSVRQAVVAPMVATRNSQSTTSGETGRAVRSSKTGRNLKVVE